MAEPFYRLGEWIVPPIVKMQGTAFTFQGLENIPSQGGAILAQNHTSYLDWLPPLLAVRERGRAARMALEAQVPLVPLIVWGVHRIWSKDHPKKLIRNKTPVTVAAGRPLPPRGDTEHLNAALRSAMNALLYRVQEEYPHPEGEHWVPRRLGGGAPNQDDSRAIRLAELQERAKKYGYDGVTRPGQDQSGTH